MDKDVKVAAIMTAPRYESVWARNQIEGALHKAGIPLTISGGVFYGQCMQRMMADVVDIETDYVLTVDFDSIFTSEHVHRLLSIIVQQDEIDALAAVQPMRGQGRILAAVKEETRMTWTGNPIRVKSAHFGLTVISCDALKSVAKPWFHSVPDTDGGWGDGKIDDDVSFWRAWETAGHSVYIDPGCRLGHLEEMITVYQVEGEQMKPAHLYPKEWEKERACSVD